MRNRMLLFALLLLALAAPAGATAIQPWNLSGVNVVNMTSFDAFLSGVTFDSPGATSFSVGGWSASLINPQHVQASGTATSNLNFNFLFTSPVTSPFDIDVYNGNRTFIESWHFSAAGVAPGSTAGWTQNSGPTVDVSSVPEPASMALLGTGLIAFGWIRRRRVTA